MKTTYQKVVDAGLEYSNHESDLYVKDCETARIIIAEHEFSSNATKFCNQIDGKIWWDIPFAFDPWWEKRKQSISKAEGR